MGALETGVITLSGQATTSEKEPTPWHHSYKRWRETPKYWKTQFLSKLGMGLTVERLNNMEFRDPESINQMFDYFLQLRPEDFFPTALLCKELCASVCYKRHEDVGSMSIGVKQKAIAGYKIDWLAGGVYTVRLHEEDPTGLVIIHQPTKTEVVISRAAVEPGAEVEIVKNWVDMDVELIMPNGFRCKLVNLFKKGEGLWKYNLDDKATQRTSLAVQCQASFSERLEQQVKTSLSQDSMAL